MNGDHRVFYDVDEAKAVVFVRAVRRKPPHTTTKDWETVTLETSPALWDLIEARRKEPTLSVDELARRTR